MGRLLAKDAILRGSCERRHRTFGRRGSYQCM